MYTVLCLQAWRTVRLAVLGFLGITTIYTLMEGAGNLGSKLMPGQFLLYTTYFDVAVGM
jgi:hypothetical protein